MKDYNKSIVESTLIKKKIAPSIGKYLWIKFKLKLKEYYF